MDLPERCPLVTSFALGAGCPGGGPAAWAYPLADAGPAVHSLLFASQWWGPISVGRGWGGSRSREGPALEERAALASLV